MNNINYLDMNHMNHIKKINKLKNINNMNNLILINPARPQLGGFLTPDTAGTCDTTRRAHVSHVPVLRCFALLSFASFA